MEEASKRSYQFWDTQPVPKLGEVVNTHGPVEPDKDNIRQEPYTLPQGFTWDALDLGDRGVLKELYTLLNENYVEDDDNMFRFDYSLNFFCGLSGRLAGSPSGTVGFEWSQVGNWLGSSAPSQQTSISMTQRRRWWRSTSFVSTRSCAPRE